MDTVTHLEYPERIITHNAEIIIRDINNPVPQIYDAKDIQFIRPLNKDLFLRLHKHYQCVYAVYIFNGKLEVQKSFTINLRHESIFDILFDIFPILVLNRYLVLITVANHKTYTFLIDLNETNTSLHPDFSVIDGETITVFQLDNEIITFQRHYIQIITCRVIYIHEKINIDFHKAYPELTKHLANADATTIIAFEDNHELNVCAVCCYRSLIAIFNSKGKIIYKTGYLNRCEIAYDKYANNIIVMGDKDSSRGLYRIYKGDGKWMMTEFGEKLDYNGISVITRKKIITWNYKIHMSVDKQTMEVINHSAFGVERKFYYDFYDKWLNNELERLLNIDALRKINRDILILILSYVS